MKLFHVFCRLQQLTRLELYRAVCSSPLEEVDCPATLRVLQLRRTHYSIDWLTTFLAQLPRLTYLEIEFAFLLDEDYYTMYLPQQQS